MERPDRVWDHHPRGRWCTTRRWIRGEGWWSHPWSSVSALLSRSPSMIRISFIPIRAWICICPRRATYSLRAFGWAALVAVPDRVVESIVCCCVVYLCLSRVHRGASPTGAVPTRSWGSPRHPWSPCIFSPAGCPGKSDFLFALPSSLFVDERWIETCGGLPRYKRSSDCTRSCWLRQVGNEFWGCSWTS